MGLGASGSEATSSLGWGHEGLWLRLLHSPPAWGQCGFGVWSSGDPNPLGCPDLNIPGILT